MRDTEGNGKAENAEFICTVYSSQRYQIVFLEFDSFRVTFISNSCGQNIFLHVIAVVFAVVVVAAECVCLKIESNNSSGQGIHLK